MDKITHTELKEDEISLAELIQKAAKFLSRVKRDKKVIFYCLAITIPIGLLLAFGTTPQYSASMRIMPYGAAAPSGGLSSLAGLAGLNMNRGAGQTTVLPEMYPDIAQLLDFRIAISETPLYFSSMGDFVTPTTYFTEYSAPSFADNVKKYTIGLPNWVIGSVIGWFKSEDESLSIGEDPTPNLAKYPKEYLKLVTSIGESYTVETEKLKDFRSVTSLKISAIMPDAEAAAGLTKVVAEQLMETVIQFEIRKTKDELVFLEEQHDKMELRYINAQAALANFRDRTRNTTSFNTQSQLERLQNEFTLSYNLYSSVRSQLEEARIKLNRDTPVFTILENVVVPNEPSAPRKGRILFLSLFLGVIFGVGIIGAKVYWEQIHLEEPQS